MNMDFAEIGEHIAALVHSCSGGGAGLRESELTQWASEHLSGTVLKSLHELVVSEPMPVMEGK